ncbi:MAG: hypothetical protein JO131_01110, partial [Gammaproteobacteria bacterium]|nr:hypothetical protein [Gammaproteobacteria bacterium]
DELQKYFLSIYTASAKKFDLNTMKTTRAFIKKTVDIFIVNRKGRVHREWFTGNKAHTRLFVKNVLVDWTIFSLIMQNPYYLFNQNFCDRIMTLNNKQTMTGESFITELDKNFITETDKVHDLEQKNDTIINSDNSLEFLLNDYVPLSPLTILSNSNSLLFEECVEQYRKTEDIMYSVTKENTSFLNDGMIPLLDEDDPSMLNNIEVDASLTPFQQSEQLPFFASNLNLLFNKQQNTSSINTFENIDQAGVNNKKRKLFS